MLKLSMKSFIGDVRVSAQHWPEDEVMDRQDVQITHLVDAPLTSEGYLNVA